MKKIIPILSLLLIIGLLIFILIPKHDTAPDFQLTDLKGQNITQQNLQGKVTLINFWFPSCPGCVTEMPKLIKMAYDYQNKDFQILGIAVPEDPLQTVQQYVQERQIPFTIMYDNDRIVTKLFVKTELFPTSILIDKQGNILKTFVGEPNFATLYQEVDTELQK